MEKENDLISIIVPVYNVENYLQRCIDSIVNQSYCNIEVLLINDGSTDGSLAICNENAKKDGRIIVINQNNHGLAFVRNKGLSIAKGEYVMFVDSDDFIDLHMTECLYTNMKKENAQISSCGHKELYENGYQHNNNRLGIYKVYSAEEALRVFLFTYEIDVICCNKMYKRALFDNVSFPSGNLFEDHFTVYKLIEKSNRIVYDSTPLYYYCKRGNSIGGSAFSLKNMQLEDAVEQEVNYIISKYPSIADDLKLARICWLIVLYDKMMLVNQVDVSFENKLNNLVRQSLFYALSTNDIRISRKIQILLFHLNKVLYKHLYLLFIKKYRGAKH